MYAIFLPRAHQRRSPAPSNQPDRRARAFSRRAAVLARHAALITMAILWSATTVTAQTLDEELARDDFGSYGAGAYSQGTESTDVSGHIEQVGSIYPGEIITDATSDGSSAAHDPSARGWSYPAYAETGAISEGPVVGRPASPIIHTSGQPAGVSSAQTSTGVAVTQSAYLSWNDNSGFDRDPRAKTIRRLIEDSASTLDTFLADGNYEPMWRLVDDAKALVIVPRLVQGGFIFGGSGGNAIVISRLPDGGWSHPTFFTMGSASFGLQIGAEFSETVLFAMTDRGRNQFLQSTVKLGGDIGVAAGPYGAGAKAQTTDILAFSRSRGLYGGISIEGSVLKRRTAWDKLYYGSEQITSADILIRNAAGNPHSRPVHDAANRLLARGASLSPHGAGR